MRLFVSTLILFAICVTASKIKNGAKTTTEKYQEASSKNSVVDSTEGPQEKLLESWLSDGQSTEVDTDEDDRTWRLNRKALMPILIGVGLKSLALVALSLTVLTVIGSVAIGTSKLSLALSAFMLLKRFFSNDTESGGFYGLNPLKFPQRTETHHSYPPGGVTGVNRRLWKIQNPLG